MATLANLIDSLLTPGILYILFNTPCVSSILNSVTNTHSTKHSFTHLGIPNTCQHSRYIVGVH